MEAAESSRVRSRTDAKGPAPARRIEHVRLRSARSTVWSRQHDGKEASPVGAVRIALGAFAALAGAAFILRGLMLAVHNRRSAQTARRSALGWEFWLGVSLLAAGVLLIMSPADGGDTDTTPESTALSERTAFGVIGALAICTAVVMWIFADRLTSRFGRQRKRAASDETTSDDSSQLGDEVLSEGPLNAVSKAFWRRLGVRRAAVLIAAFGIVYLAGVLWPSVPNAMLDGLGALEDVGELLLLLVWLSFAVFCVVSGVKGRQRASLWFGTTMLALLVMVGVLSVRTGLLDGWVRVASWLKAPFD